MFGHFALPFYLITYLLTLLTYLFLTSLSPGVVSQGWHADPTTRMVMPKKPGRWQCCSSSILGAFPALTLRFSQTV